MMNLPTIRETLLSRRATLTGHGGELSAERVPGDSIDAAGETEATAVACQLSSIEAGELERLDAAIERLDAGTYGVCVVCGHTIVASRIDALPCAERCIACQRKWESGDLEEDNE
jgi:RNA polymerase-binding transcription factor DksA